LLCSKEFLRSLELCSWTVRRELFDERVHG
jgi:hypothetical protein